MKKLYWVGTILLLSAIFLVACGEDQENQSNSKTDEEELKSLDVNFEVPETVEKGEEVELKAVVTYGDEKVKDADEVQFEYWIKGNEDDSTKIEATNNEDGTYTANVTFDKNAVFEIFSHVTARDLHTMPKKSVTVGDGESDMHHAANEDGKEEHESHSGHEGDGDGHAHTDGFSMHFKEPEDVKAGETTPLIVHLTQDDQPLKGVKVRYEIVPDGNKEKTMWVDAKEDKAGEYTAEHTFKESGAYTTVIHVEDDKDLHEHKEYDIEVK
ncbi:FixH family protein [Virgibacillus halodenitrificans]|uniref:FixH family protein n=1 Tax=Virgibacillus halodenitrificans TaxID=1482 RepID=UPI000308A02F|nr:FixH family protein [Virgibacillus halodenitrificans]MCJ0932132.1 FixH family protein [Virgibacillus halodenitrificans]MYL44129.1 hypothetical protein [Virgibacillus halodenitrificans]MYL59126.1 hypothetical protein [Virgibacillus halodenitrificans]